MSVWADFEDFYHDCMGARTLPQLHSVLGRYAENQGYDNNVLTSIGDKRLKRVAWYSFPDPYPEAYISNQWERIDPVLRASLVARRPFRWDDVAKHAKLSAPQKEFLGASAELLVTDGITFPLHGPNGRCEILSLSSKTAVERDPARLNVLNAIVTQAWWRYVELSGEAAFDLDDMTPCLTPKQRDVLSWVKDGKTNSEIAEIMTVSVKTIEFHMSAILDKLGATNRISAVVIALQRGLI